MCNTHRNPIQCILPPYISEKFEKTEEIPKEESLDNELRNHRFRSDRIYFSEMPKASLEMMLITKAKPAKPKASIELYNLRHKYSLPGKRMMAADIAKDKDAKNVLRGTKRTWNFYYSIFSRNSIDNAGMTLVNSIHYGKRYSNAMWNGRQMVYGDGDKKVFGSFTLDIDIIAHELAHGVTQYAANFDYENQSGALNESYSDVFGIMVKQFARKQQVDESNWLIGENIMLGDAYALRSLAAPGTAFRGHPSWGDDPQPATMDNYIHLPNTEKGDWGGVHYNSGIPNYAFYIAAMEAGGFAWETVGKAWYAALTSSLNNRSDFAEARRATIAQAKKLFGTNSKVHKAVVRGWKAAKVK
jgi:Zn-dependent metalloprotease